jgi:hypothetical protein
VQYQLSVVDKRPLYIWGTEIRALTLEFLDDLNASSFEYPADTHLQPVCEDQDLRQASFLDIHTEGV